MITIIFYELTFSLACKDYTNPYIPVNPTANGGFSTGHDGDKIEFQSNVLLASIENMQYAVTVDVFHTEGCCNYYLKEIRIKLNSGVTGVALTSTIYMSSDKGKGGALLIQSDLLGKNQTTTTMAEMGSMKAPAPILKIMELANMISVPMSLNAVVRLNVAAAIWQDGSNTPISAAQILSAAGLSATADPHNLDRILRLLSSYGVFHEHCPAENSSQRRYSLTEVGKTLVPGAVAGDSESYGPYVLQHHHEALLRAWPLVHEAVLDSSVEPFAKANGEPAYVYYGKDPEMNELMQRAMTGVSAPFIRAFLDGYDGFQGVETLVDVGGSSGDCLAMIIAKNPNVKTGINFDLPEVIRKASFNAKFPVSITHVGGDMFKSIPPGDAIFMKWMLTTCTDDECLKVLSNCHGALPPTGKVIACEPVLPGETDDSHRTRALLAGDIFVMTIYNAKGRERTEAEYKELGISAGFSMFKSTVFMDHFFTVLEFLK